MKKVSKKHIEENKIVLYKAQDGEIELRVNAETHSVWATQAHIVKLFGVDQSVVSRHIKNIFSDKEIEEKSNMQKMHIANSDKPVTLYGLDVILAVGYRTNSKTAIEFRRWATRILKYHITKGYTINRERIQENWLEFESAITQTKKLLPKEYFNLSVEDSMDLVSLFARTWLSLDAYDKQELSIKKPTKKKVSITTSDLENALGKLKTTLIKKGEATDLFANPRTKGNLEGIVGNIMQSFGGVPVYASIEEKAANLLYFIVKDHPFLDGNKRSGAFAFIWFLEKYKRLDLDTMSPQALTALTLLVAISNPKEKTNIVSLIMKLIEK